MQKAVLSVRQLNLYVRSLLEGDIRLNDVTVSGELSNFKNHYSSGHLYFTLKDNDASIRCVMFRAFASRVRFTPEDGIKVVLRGKVSLYEKDGQYQFYAEEMSAAGIGDLALQFEQIKAKLQAEGLFDTESKRKIPSFPKRIAVVTSDTGAAVQDIMNILSRRWPLCTVIMCPVAVQGENAVPSMLEALDRLYGINSADVIIIGRGGGSAEDLAAFNDEALARKIYESPVPVISAVGHETDFSICDFVADLRAPTPSAAAELAVPSIEEVLGRLDRCKALLRNQLLSKYNVGSARLKACLNSPYFKNPIDTIVERKHLEIDSLSDRLNGAVKAEQEALQAKLAKNAAKLEALSPLKVLSRGYAAVQKSGETVNSVKGLSAGDNISLKLSDGSINCSVTEIFKEDENV